MAESSIRTYSFGNAGLSVNPAVQSNVANELTATTLERSGILQGHFVRCEPINGNCEEFSKVVEGGPNLSGDLRLIEKKKEEKRVRYVVALRPTEPGDPEGRADLFLPLLFGPVTRGDITVTFYGLEVPQGQNQKGLSLAKDINFSSFLVFMCAEGCDGQGIRVTQIVERQLIEINSSTSALRGAFTLRPSRLIDPPDPAITIPINPDTGVIGFADAPSIGRFESRIDTLVFVDEDGNESGRIPIQIGDVVTSIVSFNTCFFCVEEGEARDEPDICLRWGFTHRQGVADFSQNNTWTVTRDAIGLVTFPQVARARARGPIQAAPLEFRPFKRD